MEPFLIIALIVIALVVVTIFLIVNTIKLTISARKREISIMRLVGASNFTIKTPFIFGNNIKLKTLRHHLSPHSHQ